MIIDKKEKRRSEIYFKSVESSVNMNLLFDSIRKRWKYRYFHFINYIKVFNLYF